MDSVFNRACNELLPRILTDGFVIGPDQISAIDGSVTRTVTVVNSDDEVEIVLGKHNAERVTMRWGENELVIDLERTRRFSVLFNVGLRQTAQHQSLATLDEVFTHVMRRLGVAV